MENTTVIFKWKTGKIEILTECIAECSAAELKKFLNTATENREEVQEQVREYLTGKYAELDPEALKREGKALSSYGEKKRKHIKSLLSIFEDRKQTKQERALSKIVKSCAENRPDFSGVFQDAGKYCVLDGYRLIRCASPLTGLGVSKKTFDTEKAIGNLADYTVSLQLPTIKELKADIKIAKNGIEFGRYHIDRNGKKIFVLYDFGYGLPLVNAEYLLSMLEALPECEAFAVPGKVNHPIYFRSGNDDGILLPVYKMQEYEEAPAETAEMDAQSAAELQPTGDMEPQEESTEAAEETTIKAAADEEYQADEEKALARVEAVAAAVKVSDEDNNILSGICRLFKRGLITEDEAKHLLAFPVSAIWPTSLALPAPAVEPDSMTVVVVDLSVAAAPVSVAGRNAGQEEAPPGYEETSASDHDKRFSVVSMPFCGGPPGKVSDSLPASCRSFCSNSALAAGILSGFAQSFTL